MSFFFYHFLLFFSSFFFLFCFSYFFIPPKNSPTSPASADFSARLWDAVTGNQVHEFVHKHIVKSVHFAGDRSKLATAGHEGILRIFDVGSPGSPPTEVRFHLCVLLCFMFFCFVLVSFVLLCSAFHFFSSLLTDQFEEEKNKNMFFRVKYYGVDTMQGFDGAARP